MPLPIILSLLRHLPTPWQSEGRTNREWILLDYVDVVVHVFLRDRRQFYALEELWGDAEFTYVEDTADATTR
jgi:ribosome-associated protein